MLFLLLRRVAVARNIHTTVKTCNDMVSYFTDDDFSSMLTAKVYKIGEFRLTLFMCKSFTLIVFCVELQLKDMYTQQSKLAMTWDCRSLIMTSHRC